MLKNKINLDLRRCTKNIFLVLLGTYKEIQDAQLFMVSSSLAYTTLLSIIPLLAVSFAIFQAFGGMHKLYEMAEPLLLSNLAEGTSEQMISKLHEFIDNAHTGIVGIGGLVGLVVTGMSMLSNIEKAINHVWKVKITRSLFQRFCNYWLLITLGPLALSVVLGIVSSADHPVMNLLPSSSGLYTIVVLLLYLIYKYVPQTKVKWQSALIAAIVTSALWNLARYGYAVYTKNVVTYSKVYGSLGAVPILMLWIYIEWVIVLTGVALTSSLQKLKPKLD